MKFPTTEAGLLELAMNIENGLTVYPADFPNIDPMDFANIKSSYTTARNSSEAAKIAARSAIIAKETKLDQLADLMKKVVKQAEVDTAANPEKLFEIGWGPRKEPTSVSVPNAPSDLTATFEGESSMSLQLNWKKPVNDPTRPVVNFIIQRKDRLADNQWSEWLFCDMTYRTSTALIGQPKGIAMEYRVKATNAAGSSNASNSVAVIL